MVVKYLYIGDVDWGVVIVYYMLLDFFELVCVIFGSDIMEVFVFIFIFSFQNSKIWCYDVEECVFVYQEIGWVEICF